jgi:uncharacterized protein DUF695
MALQECWGLYEKQYEGHPLRVRLNEGIEEYVCHPRYMYQVCITVSLNDVDENGFPFPEECKLLDELEMLFKDKLQQQQISVFAAVLTSDGSRIYILYTYLPDFCQNAVDELNNDWIYHEIVTTTQEDRNWETIEALLENT